MEVARDCKLTVNIDVTKCLNVSEKTIHSSQEIDSTLYQIL